jgi:hypothetical protein
VRKHRQKLVFAAIRLLELRFARLQRFFDSLALGDVGDRAHPSHDPSFAIPFGCVRAMHEPLAEPRVRERNIELHRFPA